MTSPAIPSSKVMMQQCPERSFLVLETEEIHDTVAHRGSTFTGIPNLAWVEPLGRRTQTCQRERWARASATIVATTSAAPGRSLIKATEAPA